MENIEANRGKIRQEFIKTYGTEPRLFRAPGRVNLIGEHTDYNDGFALPFAIDLETVTAGNSRKDRIFQVTALDIGETVVIDLNEPEVKLRGDWIDYVEGTIRCVARYWDIKTGADLMISSTVPIGGGLSSSAALEVSIGYAVLQLNGIDGDEKQLALAAQQAEHEFVGIRSGIMDQFTAVFGKPGHALLLDCRAISAEPVPLELPEHLIVVCDTKVKHSLASSEYNKRRAECEVGVRLLKYDLPEIQSLRDVTGNDLEQFGPMMPETIRRRCEHVIEENQRVLDMAKCLANGDLIQAGQLLYFSHGSLRDKYEVSSPELDALVEIVRDIDGVLGARMIGGGFGGCTVNLIEKNVYEKFRSETVKRYKADFSNEPLIFAVEAGGGVSEIR